MKKQELKAKLLEQINNPSSGHLLRDTVNAKLSAHRLKKGSKITKGLKDIEINEDIINRIKAGASGLYDDEYKEVNQIYSYK